MASSIMDNVIKRDEWFSLTEKISDSSNRWRILMENPIPEITLGRECVV